jgi:hypothetical protein
MTMRLNPEERRQIEEVARLWGCRVTEVLRLCFRMVMLGEKSPGAMTNDKGDIPFRGNNEIKKYKAGLFLERGTGRHLSSLGENLFCRSVVHG